MFARSNKLSEVVTINSIYIWSYDTSEGVHRMKSRTTISIEKQIICNSCKHVMQCMKHHFVQSVFDVYAIFLEILRLRKKKY